MTPNVDQIFTQEAIKPKEEEPQVKPQLSSSQSIIEKPEEIKAQPQISSSKSIDLPIEDRHLPELSRSPNVLEIPVVEQEQVKPQISETSNAIELPDEEKVQPQLSMSQNIIEKPEEAKVQPQISSSKSIDFPEVKQIIPQISDASYTVEFPAENKVQPRISDTSNSVELPEQQRQSPQISITQNVIEMPEEVKQLPQLSHSPNVLEIQEKEIPKLEISSIKDESEFSKPEKKLSLSFCNNSSEKFSQSPKIVPEVESKERTLNLSEKKNFTFCTNSSEKFSVMPGEDMVQNGRKSALTVVNEQTHSGENRKSSLSSSNDQNERRTKKHRNSHKPKLEVNNDYLEMKSDSSMFDYEDRRPLSERSKALKLSFSKVTEVVDPDNPDVKSYREQFNSARSKPSITFTLAPEHDVAEGEKIQLQDIINSRFMTPEKDKQNQTSKMRYHDYD
ncbi:collagen adhesin domain protein, putative [Trichomonas vaginalis G3]|uniref:Collagen adhesin domain protein, putative n=1 Tax=Trichomonas vaginalis (strain ATCC PRA-98 / G3) TaxID=412133 RepID=A2FSI6_TRIV3|nr:hypothetical protein TVAGG3_0315410 [Trichomonas vaginalis G3]EAX92136.1 collagen adhesin domain protein, putative [Trichomonas vaginalis G3]KAI5528917.1 hypothetical protein TVAGG3_0315410 [Trichomonas vaginalis G3]|eukprot:XP_001305066.1 collagen adhesin domain protein [Trichomonas vaginalis G3]